MSDCLSESDICVTIEVEFLPKVQTGEETAYADDIAG